MFSRVVLDQLTLLCNVPGGQLSSVSPAMPSASIVPATHSLADWMGQRSCIQQAVRTATLRTTVGIQDPLTPRLPFTPALPCTKVQTAVSSVVAAAILVCEKSRIEQRGKAKKQYLPRRHQSYKRQHNERLDAAHRGGTKPPLASCRADCHHCNRPADNTHVLHNSLEQKRQTSSTKGATCACRCAAPASEPVDVP